jgi:uncharacterized protein YbcI
LEPYRKVEHDDLRTTAGPQAQSTAISNGIGSLHREHYGRGADRIRTVIHPELVATTLEDSFTTVETRMIAEGAFGKGARDED